MWEGGGIDPRNSIPRAAAPPGGGGGGGDNGGACADVPAPMAPRATGAPWRPSASPSSSSSSGGGDDISVHAPFALGCGHIVGANGGSGPFCSGHGVCMSGLSGLPERPDLPPGHCNYCGLEVGSWEGDGIDPRNFIPCAAAPPGGAACAEMSLPGHSAPQPAPMAPMATA